MGVGRTELTSLVDAAQLLGENYFRLWGRCVAGTLPAMKVGGRWYIRSTVLRSLLLERRTEPEPQETAAP